MRTTTEIHEAEITHGKWLLEHGAIDQWNWATPAGALRAERRASLIAGGRICGPA